jgi:ankyrin repeat protein
MGHMNIAMFLLQSDANPNFQTMHGETPLHLATRANQTDIIRVLLRHGAIVDAKARVRKQSSAVGYSCRKVCLLMNANKTTLQTNTRNDKSK